ncbi:MAG TPA: ATP-binding protein, partial [Patescibacteria group bacterium]
RRKIAEMEAEISTDIQRGRVINPATQAKLEDALKLQADLVKGEERFFQFGLYITISAESKEEINRINKNLEAALGSLLIISKRATLQMEEGFVTTLPICNDKLNITRNMDTTSLATTFPFVSSDLSDDKGIMYGINEHNGSLVIFDRFSMPNYNSVVFATAGAGKSYFIKLEAMRSLMLGTEIIVIDPENEYKDMCEAVGGQYIAFGYNEASKINPFDLSLVTDEEENALSGKVLNLHKMFKIMLGDMDAIEESILDRAIMDAYKMKGITPDPESQTKEPPLIEDLYKSLIGMEEQKAQMLAARLEKYIKGSFAGIFNQKTTVNLNNKFVVFGIRNLEEALRPVAMHIILDYIWTVVKKSLKRRLIIVDEAWYLMQYPDSASFLRGIVKRGRKYYLGVTTITQDVDDFLDTPYGKEIVTNSSIQVLLKQHSAAIDKVGEVFYLSEGEKQLLLSADKGEGIFFAGQNHVAIRAIASEEEHRLITSNPEEILKMKQEGKIPDKNIMQTEDTKGITSDLSQNVAESGLDKPKLSPIAGPTKPTIIENSVKTDGLIKNAAATNEPTNRTLNTPTNTPAGSDNIPNNPIQNINSTATTPAVTAAPATVQPQQTSLTTTNIAESGPEAQLQRRITEMEEEENKKLDEHQKKVEEERRIEEEKKKTEEAEKSKLFGGGLPKYQDLFKSADNGSNKLPPLPPLPKFEAPKPKENSNPFKDIKPETNSKTDNGLNNGNKPLFVNTNTQEPKIPQPPQLSKKPKPDFIKPEEDKEKQIEVKPAAVEAKSNNADKPTTPTPTANPQPTLIKTPPTPENNRPMAEVKAEVINTPAAPTADNNSKPAENGDVKTKMSYDDLFGNGIV